MASSKLPAIQFYPGDWRKDVGVQALSFHDRGVWFEILLLMHGSEQRGVLTLNGKAMTDEALARVLGLDIDIEENEEYDVSMSARMGGDGLKLDGSRRRSSLSSLRGGEHAWP